VLARYRARRCPADLAENKRLGGPRLASAISTERLPEVLHIDPLTLGYAAVSRTVLLPVADVPRGGDAEMAASPRCAHAMSTLARGRHGLETGVNARRACGRGGHKSSAYYFAGFAVWRRWKSRTKVIA